MWKKVLVVLISLVGTFSVVYAVNNNLSATTSTYLSGGAIDGRINIAPTGLNAGGNTGLQKGDRVLLGASNPKDGSDLSWLIIGKQVIYDTAKNKEVVDSKNWIAMSNKSIGNGSHLHKNSVGAADLSYFITANKGAYQPFTNSSDSLGGNEIARTITLLNNSFVGNDLKVISDRDQSRLNRLNNMETVGYIKNEYADSLSTAAIASEFGKKAFIYELYSIVPFKFGSASIFIEPFENSSPKDLKFSEEYVTRTSYALYSSGPDSSVVIHRIDGATGEMATQKSGNGLTKYPIRPAVTLNFNDVVFGVSKGSVVGVGTVTEPNLPSAYTDLYNDTSSFKDLKLRLHDTSMNVTLNDLKNTNSASITEIAQGETMQIDATANSVSNSVLSVLLFQDGKFAYYLPLEPVKSSGTYAFDTTGLPLGDYQLAVVNEVYDDTSNEPANSSLLSDVKDLSIVDPLALTYTASPQSSMTTYEYSKNVAPGTKVGELAYQDGVGTPALSIIADPNAPSGHSNDFNNFEITASPTSSPVDVIIKSTGAPDIANGFLKAGDYYFRIEGVDANGDPNPAVYQDVHITVNKTDPTLTFATSTQKDMKIGDTTFSDTMNTSNKDTINASDITYSLNGGVASILTATTNSTNPLQYDIDVVTSYTGTGLPTTYTLTASIAETDNYNAVTTSTNRNIYVYKELSGLTWSPSKGSYSTTDVIADSTIGSLLAVDGVGPYTYELVKSTDTKYDSVKGADNSAFTVTNVATASGTSVSVKTASALTSKTYNMQFKVKDSKGNEFYTDATITVSSKGQAALEFKDAAGGTTITSTGLTIKYDAVNPTLIAEGGSTSSPIEYDFAPASMQLGSISASSYATIGKFTGVITPIRTGGPIKVQAKRPGDSTYGDIVTYMDLKIEPAEQTIAFNKTGTVDLKIGSTQKIDATGTIKSSGLTGIGSITYTSSDPLIATVDKNTGDVTGVKAGTVTITAEMNNKNEANYDSNYDTVSATKTVNIYKPMSLSWADVSPLIKAESNAVNDKVGTIRVSDNASVPTYAISTKTGAENTDASFFSIVGSGITADLKLAKTISASDQSSHGGTFKVQVDVSDKNGTETIDLSIQIDEADNDIYFTNSGSKVTSLTKQFGENGNTFTLTSTSSNGGAVTYSVDTSDTSGTLSATGTGAVTINKVGTGIVKAVVASGNGFAGGTITMNVTVTPGAQAVAFKDTMTLNQAYTLNKTFDEPAELKETSKNTVITTRSITYKSNSPTICSIDSTGKVTMLATGVCDIEASNKDANWTPVTTTKKINLYDGMGVSFAQNGNPQAETISTNAGAKAGDLSVNGGIDPKTFKVSTSVDTKNKDASLFQVNTTGVVSFKKAIMATDLAGKYNTTKKVYELYVQLETVDSVNTKVVTDAIVEIIGAPLNAEIDTKGTGKISEEYGLGKTFTLNLSSNLGGGTPTYQLKNDPSMPNDVLQSVDASGLVTIRHANDKSFVGNPLMVEAIIPASNGYAEETVEAEVEITKAPQPAFAFKTPNIKLGHGASITPAFTGKLSGGTITLTSGNNALATISGSDIKAKTTDGKVVITAIESGDRDYKSATATANVDINSAPAYNFVISVPAATYGDTGLKATIVLNEATGANKSQTWSSSNPTIADIDASGNLTIKKAGSVTITCKQTSTGEPSVTATAELVVDPKPITVTIDNASKYVGEKIPAFHAVIPTADLVGSDTLGQPTFSCKDGTSLVNADTKAGKYDINGTYPTGSQPNYAITVKKGILTVKQDASQPAWFHLEGVTSKIKLDGTKWVNEDVNVVLDTASESAGTYDEISLNKTLWGTTQTINKEGATTSDVYFRIKDKNILSTPQSTTVKIDKTKPIVKSITGTPANRNALSELLNTLTFGKYFKPKYEVSIVAEDVLPKDVKENSKLKTINYNVYQIKDDATIGEAIASGEMGSGDTLKLVDEGKYMVCAIAEDNAGNKSAELCSGIRIQSIGESSDGKELPDINIDIDGDGKADINITRPGEKKPYLNIDSDGDGKADINISREGEEVIPGTTKPFLNIISDAAPWKPEKEVDMDGDGKPDYRTNGDLEPVMSLDSNNDKIPDLNIDLDGDNLPDINIDIDGNKVPDTNIDSDGDGIADINIDKTGTGKPQEQICTKVVWNPTSMVKKDDLIIYGTTSGLKPDSKDSLTDNGIIIKPSNPGTVFLPNYALKVNDVTKDLDDKTNNQIIEVTGTKSEVKRVFDVSLSDGNNIIQPDGSIVVRIPVDETIKNPRVLLRNKAGEFEEIDVTVEDGYYVFETDYLGTVSIVGDKEETAVDPSDPKDPEEPTTDPKPTTPDKTPTTSDNNASTSTPDTSVKGTYYSSMGGALTGDDTNVVILGIAVLFSTMVILKVKKYTSL